ncbi:hypothetical protein [Butyrivibrio sp.]|uniref:hypothetical protein n=1 Tax=Butyrivibrio sp. TaxID=28121 RepID=UPI0025C10EE6|nr:hypothetical protein [Butyrivibrio sp.]MBE5838354.1 DUF342 domain-containing protein [Butyrivibrio sp.]
MVSKKLRKVMHRSLAVATSAILIATASIGAGFTVSAEGDYEDATETVVSNPDSSKPDEQSSKEVGNITSDSEGIYVANEGSVTAHGDVEAKGTGIQNEGGTVNVDGNVNATEGSTSTNSSGIEVNGEGTVTVGENVTGAINGIYVTGGGVVNVGGNVTGLTEDGVGIYGHYSDEDREVNGTVTVGGDVTGDYGLYINKGKVDVSGNVTGDYTGVTAYDKSDIKVGGDVTGGEYGIRSDESTISVEGSVTGGGKGIRSSDSTISVGGSVKGSIESGIESKGSNITVEKDVEGNAIGIGASTTNKYVYNEPAVLDEDLYETGYLREAGEYVKIEENPSNVNVGGNVTGGVFGVLSDYGSTVHVKGDVTASGKIEMEETEDEEFDDSDKDIYSKIPSAAIGVIIGMDNDDGPRLRTLEISDDEDIDPETRDNWEEDQEPESVKGVVIVEETVKSEDNGNGAYGVLLLNKGYETAAEVIAATPDIVVYEFNLGDNGEVVGYRDYGSLFGIPEYYELRSAPMLAATNEEDPVDEADIDEEPVDDDDIDEEPSDDADELAQEVIDTVKGLINYIIKHDEEVTLDSLNDGEDVRVFGDGLETMRIGEVLNIKFQEGYELDNEDYLKTIASVEKISDGVYKITLNSELGGINIKALKKAIEEEIIDDPVVDPDEPDNKEDDPIDQPQENNDPVVVIIEESDPDPAPDSESDPDPEPASAPAPAVVSLVATTVAEAPAPTPVEPAVLGEKREAAVLGARKASTDDTTNSPIRAIIIIIASLGALVVCGAKYSIKER